MNMNMNTYAKQKRETNMRPKLFREMRKNINK